MTDPEIQKDAIHLLVSDIHRLCSSSYYRGLKNKGIELTRAQWRVLSLLALKDGRKQSELAEAMLMEKAPLGVLLDKLEAKQLIERLPDPDDRRAKRIFITNKADPLTPVMREVSDSIADKAAESLTTDELEQLDRLLKIIRSNLSCLRKG